MLNQASTRIGSTLDVSRTAQELVELAVPGLADFATVDLLEGLLSGGEPAPGPVTGSVVLHAIIGKDGTVSQLEVVSGHPLLVQSALDAVKQWRYQPEVLNGDPVEVDTTITVTFQLGG